MGGHIRVVHKIDGVIHAQTRHTNSLPEYVQSAKFFSGDREFIEKYLQAESGYRYPGDDKIAPDGYGLDFYNFDNKIIHSCQGYCSYEDIDFVTISLWETGGIYREPGDTYYYPDVVKELWEAGYLSILARKDGNNKTFHGDKTKIITKEQSGEDGDTVISKMRATWNSMHSALQGVKRLIDKFIPSSDSKYSYSGFVMDWKGCGWTYFKYEESYLGYKAMLENIKKHTEIDPGSQKLWDECLDEQKAEYYEEEEENKIPYKEYAPNL